MSVDFPSSYPTNTPTSVVGKSADVQTLQEAFAAALRNYGTENGITATDTILEVVRPASQTDNTNGDDRNQQRQEQQANRSDIVSVERKLLEKSEVRSNDMNVDYRERTDRNETLRSDYQGRLDRNESQQQTVQPNISNPAIPLPDAARPSESVSGREMVSSQQTIPATTVTNSQVPSANVPHNAPNGMPKTGQMNVLLPGSNIPAALPRASVSPVVPPQAFTVFTPSGRLGQAHKKADGKEQEDEESVEGQESIKQHPFAVFEAIHAETMRQPRHNVARQPKEPDSPPITEKPHAKPKEVEPAHTQNVKTIAELLDMPPQNVGASPKEKPNQSSQLQYLNRIAAACEAAAQHAPIRMKLNLEHLGTLTLRFFHKSDKLALRFETPSKESAQFLRDNLDDLRTILSKRNVKITSIEILE